MFRILTKTMILDWAIVYECQHISMSFKRNKKKARLKSAACKVSTVERSEDLSNDWAKIWDNGGQIDTFTLDFEKAVRAPQEQTVWLWHTWEDPEIDHHSFLCYRQQRVVVNGAKSDWARCCLVSRRTLSLVPCCFPGTLMISQQTLILKQDSLRMTVFVTEKLRIQRTH